MKARKTNNVYLLDNHIVRKVPGSEGEEDLQPILRDALIHGVLGNHPRIAECLSQGIFDYIEIKYYPRGDPVKYLDRNSIRSGLRIGRMISPWPSAMVS